MKTNFHELSVSKIIKETEDCVSVAFQIPDSLGEDFIFSPGQYLTLKKNIKGEDVRRSYSICTSPTDKELKVAIKQIEDGRFSTFANQELKEGDIIEVMSPAGNFVPTTPYSGKHYLLIAAGSGITPILSIAKTVLQSADTQITVIYGNKTSSSVIFKEELEGLKNTYLNRVNIIHVLSRENLGNPLQQGRITGELLNQMNEKIIFTEDFTEAFICGPESMILESKDMLTELGMNSKDIHFELFNTSSSKEKKKVKIAEEDKHLADVKIIMDGDEFDFKLATEGVDILEAGQNTGADLPFACKGGVCCTCKAKVLEGSAVMDVNYALEQNEVDQGYILTCQAHPTSEKVVVSFDD